MISWRSGRYLETFLERVASLWLSMGPCLDRFDAIATHNVDERTLRKSVGDLLAVTDDIDKLLQADAGFLLGQWLRDSRAVSTWDGSNGSLADFYEWNSRVQITTWAGRYSRREWSGMVTGYYDERTRLWLEQVVWPCLQVFGGILKLA